MNILPDLNIILDYLICNRADNKIAGMVYDIIDKENYEIWISASSVDNLKYILCGESKKYKLDTKYVMKEFEKYIEKSKIFSVTGKSIRQSLDALDLEDHIMYTNFKRIAPDGIVITRDGKFKNYPDAITPRGFVENHENLSKQKNISMLDLQEEYRYILEDIDDSVLKNIARAKYILGPEVNELEDKVAEYLGVKHCVGASSGTDALVLALRALAIKTKGQEYFDSSDLIITTPFTFTATGDTILRSGATPIFVDIDPVTYNIDPNKIREYLTQHSTRVVGVLPVHLYGQSCQMDEVMSIAQEYNLFVVEDCAQAFGASWGGKRLGAIGTVGAFSFFPSKNLGGFGDAGMVSTNDDEIAELVRMLLKHGGKDKYNVEHIGYNARLDTLQAAILLAKLRYIDKFNSRRRRIAMLYSEGLKDVKDLVLPLASDALSPSLLAINSHVFHQYTVRVLNRKRDLLLQHLKEKGIDSMIYYPIPLHKMKVFGGRSRFNKATIGERASAEVLSFPIEPLMTEENILFVIRSIRDFFYDA